MSSTQAAKKLPFSIGLPAQPLYEGDDPAVLLELQILYGAVKNIASILGNSLLPSARLVAGEDVSAGNLVRIASDGMIYKATDGQVVAYVSREALAGETAEIVFSGVTPAYPASTFTPGTVYTGSPTAGLYGTTGSQRVAVAVSDSYLFFNPRY